MTGLSPLSLVRERPARLALPLVAALVLAVACTSYKAPEVKGIQNWINSEPLTIEGLRGKVVLVDFWTYTCINCIRTFPYLKSWYEQYEDDGLVIIGVHSPEFDFERVYQNVVEATQTHGITWPVAQDNDFETWKNYGNRFWPAKYLIDQEGMVRYTHFGEGAYADTEEKIRKLLEETGADLTDDTFDSPFNQRLDQRYLESRSGVTRELYAGYVRGQASDSVRQPEFTQDVGNVVRFRAPERLEPGQIYFHGDWKIGLEDARHGRTTTAYEDSLSLVFSARTVNAVLTSESGEPYRVLVTLNGQYLTEETKGVDVTIGVNGESFVAVDGPPSVQRGCRALLRKGQLSEDGVQFR